MKIDVETEFTGCVRAIGGVVIADVIGPSPNFNNADFRFEEYDVIAELKQLEKDQLNDRNAVEKVSDIYREAAAARATPAIIYGQQLVEFTSDNMPDEYRLRMAEVHRAPVQRVIKKANTQIKQTKTHMRLEGSAGLLILANDANLALDPDNVHWVLAKTLHHREYSSINSVLYFTINLSARHPMTETPVLVWATWHRPGFEPCSDGLLDSLKAACRRI